MIRTGFVHLDNNGKIINMKMPKIVATSESADIIYMFADFDKTTSETAYRCTANIERADRLPLGPFLLTLSQVTQEEADSFGVDYLACRKLVMPKTALEVKGPAKITVKYHQLDQSGKVISTAAQPEFNVQVYDAVPEVLTEDEYTEIRNEFIPRDLGDITIADEFKDTDNVIVTQDGATKKITGAEFKDKVIDNIINDRILGENINDKLYVILNEKEQEYAPRLTNVENTKADINYVKTLTEAMASGSPKGVYPTLDDLEAAIPEGDNYTYVVASDGNWYYWNNLAWVSGGNYQSAVINTKTIPYKEGFLEEKLNRLYDTKNLLTLPIYTDTQNGITLTIDSNFVITLGGTNSLQSNFLFSVPLPQEIETGLFSFKLYILSGVSSSANYPRFILENKKEYGGLLDIRISTPQIQEGIVTTETIKLLAVHIFAGQTLDNCKIKLQLEKGTKATDYQSPSVTVYDETINQIKNSDTEHKDYNNEDFNRLSGALIETLDITEDVSDIKKSIDAIMDLKTAADYHSEEVFIPGLAEEKERLVLLSFHKGESKWFKAPNEIYFNNKCRNDFSDVHIKDSNGVNIPFKIIANGNYEIVSEENQFIGMMRQLSDGTLVGCFGTGVPNVRDIRGSVDNGETWITIIPNQQELTFIDSNDTIYTYNGDNIGLRRWETPYTESQLVIDLTLEEDDDGTGMFLPTSMIELPTGELLIGRYQFSNSVKIFKSIDLGLTWSVVFTNYENQHVHGLFVDTHQDPLVIYGGIDYGATPTPRFIKSVDKGETWEFINVSKACDYGVIYAGDGYRLISGEASTVGGNSIQKTTDDINFRSVLNSGKSLVRIIELGGVLYGGCTSSKDSLSATIIRSADNGETWETVFSTASDFPDGGANDGYKFPKIVSTSLAINESYIAVGVQGGTNIRPLRIYNGGDHYQALVILKVKVPIGGLTLTVESGFAMKTLSPDILLDTKISEEHLLKLKLNEGVGALVKEEVSNKNLELSTGKWINGQKKLYDFYPAIRRGEEKRSLLIDEDVYFVKPIELDLSGGDFSLSFWSTRDHNETSQLDYIIMAFNPNTPSASYLTTYRFPDSYENIFRIISGFPIATHKTVGAGLLNNSPKLYVITFSADGTVKTYVNGVLRTTITSVDFSSLNGSCYLFNTPTKAEPTSSYAFKHFNGGINNFEIINKVLTQVEITEMFESNLTSLRSN